MRASGAQVWVFPCEQCGGPARYKFAKMAKQPRCTTCKRKKVLAQQAIRGRQRTLARPDAEFGAKYCRFIGDREELDALFPDDKDHP